MVPIEKITPLILSGGFGIRLRSLVRSLPKVLAPVCGRPFLTYILDQINSAGFREVILCTGYMGDTVKETVGSANKGLDIRYSQEEKPLGTGGALRLALSLIRTDWVLAMNGDSYVDADLRIYSTWHVRNGLRASILLLQVPDVGRFGSVQLDKGNRITCFQEKSASSGPGLINAGIYVIDKSLLEIIPLGKSFSLEHEFFPELAGKCLYGYVCDARFIDIGTPESYCKAEEFFCSIIKHQRE